ncbi:MAG: hypothetical protein GY811_28165 [Myxococcales bacterium]|nr:hypothetical protein [Myxococcales bacterium]
MGFKTRVKATIETGAQLADVLKRSKSVRLNMRGTHRGKPVELLVDKSPTRLNYTGVSLPRGWKNVKESGAAIEKLTRGYKGAIWDLSSLEVKVSGSPLKRASIMRLLHSYFTEAFGPALAAPAQADTEESRARLAAFAPSLAGRTALELITSMAAKVVDEEVLLSKSVLWIGLKSVQQLPEAAVAGFSQYEIILQAMPGHSELSIGADYDGDWVIELCAWEPVKGGGALDHRGYFAHGKCLSDATGLAHSFKPLPKHPHDFVDFASRCAKTLGIEWKLVEDVDFRQEKTGIKKKTALAWLQGISQASS